MRRRQSGARVFDAPSLGAPTPEGWTGTEVTAGDATPIATPLGVHRPSGLWMLGQLGVIERCHKRGFRRSRSGGLRAWKARASRPRIGGRSGPHENKTSCSDWQEASCYGPVEALRRGSRAVASSRVAAHTVTGGQLRGANRCSSWADGDQIERPPSSHFGFSEIEPIKGILDPYAARPNPACHGGSWRDRAAVPKKGSHRGGLEGPSGTRTARQGMSEPTRASGTPSRKAQRVGRGAKAPWRRARRRGEAFTTKKRVTPTTDQGANPGSSHGELVET